MTKLSGNNANQNFSNAIKSGSPVTSSSPLIPNDNTKAYSDLANTNAEKIKLLDHIQRKSNKLMNLVDLQLSKSLVLRLLLHMP